MGVGAFAVYADSVDTNKMPYSSGYSHMSEIDFDNSGTDKQGEARRKHFEVMDEFHEENGFKGGHCHDTNGKGRGRGRGMMERSGY